MSQSVVVVGASLGGMRAAEALRAHGFTGELTVVGEEPHPPYTRPPLSKAALASYDGSGGAESLAESLRLRARSSLADVTWRLGVRVESASLEAGTLELSDGRALAFDGLVAASGLRPRRLPQAAPARGRHVLRTVEDADGLRTGLRPGARVVVVGAGFIGCEVASTARSLGADVTVIEPMSVPMMRGVGATLGRALQSHHERSGVRFVTGQGVAGLTESPHAAGRVARVVLDDGTVLDADVVIESMGSYANVEWLSGNGLDLTDGLLCDNHMRVEGRAGLVAVGDVARFPNPAFGVTPRRVEHWCVPGDTARRAAQSLAAHLAGVVVDDSEFAPVPAFWSDQFGLRLQSFGAPGLGDRVEVVEGDLCDLERGAAVTYHLGPRLIGVLLVNVPVARHQHYRALVVPQPQLV